MSTPERRSFIALYVLRLPTSRRFEADFKDWNSYGLSAADSCRIWILASPPPLILDHRRPQNYAISDSEVCAPAELLCFEGRGTLILWLAGKIDVAPTSDSLLCDYAMGLKRPLASPPGNFTVPLPTATAREEPGVIMYAWWNDGPLCYRKVGPW